MTFKIGDKGFIRVKNIFVAAEVTAIDLPMVFTHQGNSIATPTLVTYLDDVGMATYSAITPDGVDPRNGNVFEVHIKRPETVIRICPIYDDGSPPMDFHTNTPENRTEFFSDKRVVGLLEATYTFATRLYSGHSFAPNPNLERSASAHEQATSDLFGLFNLQDEARAALDNNEAGFVEVFEKLIDAATRIADAGKADATKVKALWNDIAMRSSPTLRRPRSWVR